ncbi:hypothetical protein CLV78_11431 [Aliiruegeria haliotis]|uniref:Sulfotransferase domain-containing protein n=1 Tax=Aliiruegeria haliotis TaxID=1280846 RepID=A0A2T0RGB6_9RHOB|nr:hypothetical protein [Aliiruegeria haliotis]PRY20246.1 hypothetical protein CLV78_11431 [Aliiruegeria haliotis]
MVEPLSISFDVNGGTHKITLPEPGNQETRSVFILGLPKGGSTLLNRLMQPLCKHAGLAPFNLPATMRNLGLKPDRWPEGSNDLYLETGYAYVGYRGWPQPGGIPAFASGRTVFLVRDPRDMLVSLYFSQAFSHTPPGQEADEGLAKEFERQRSEAQQQELNDFALENAPRLSKIYQADFEKVDAIEHRVWRYEDVIFEKLTWVDEMLKYLDLDVSANRVAAIVQRNDVRPEAENPSDHIRRVSPGDHRDKLKSETIARLNDVFADFLARYGYRQAT